MLWICRSCSAPRAVGLDQCPECGRKRYDEEGEQMPKISRNGGASYEGHEGLVEDALGRVSEIDPDHQGRTPLVGEPTEKGADEAYAGTPRRKDEAEEDGTEEEVSEPSPGTSSSRSTESKKTATRKI